MTRPIRTGGRAARHAARAAPLPDASRPVRPGLTGGRYKPLTEADVARIHETALTALEEIGLSGAPPSGVATMTAAGAVQSAGAAVSVVDAMTGNYRDSTLADLHEAARLADALDNIHFLQRPMVARDMADDQTLNLNTLHACLTGTRKHVGTSFCTAATVPMCLDYLYAVAVGEEAFRARPFVLNSNCFVVPPMRFATESCEVMEACIRGGMPVLLLSGNRPGLK